MYACSIFSSKNIQFDVLFYNMLFFVDAKQRMNVNVEYSIIKEIYFVKKS